MSGSRRVTSQNESTRVGAAGLHDMKWLDLQKICWTVTFVTVVMACKSQDSHPESGQVKLEYVSTSDSGAVFDLENGSAHPLRINGSGSSRAGIDVYLGEYSLSCRRGNESGEDPDGSSDPPKFTDIKPGVRVRLRVHTKLTRRYKGGDCELWLTVFGATVDSVTSGEFVP
jgi:hypothetical protein